MCKKKSHGIKLRRDEVRELKYQLKLNILRQHAVRHEMKNAENIAGFGSYPYRILWMKLLDITQEECSIEMDLNKRGWFYILTGKLWLSI